MWSLLPPWHIDAPSPLREVYAPPRRLAFLYGNYSRLHQMEWKSPFSRRIYIAAPHSCRHICMGIARRLPLFPPCANSWSLRLDLWIDAEIMVRISTRPCQTYLIRAGDFHRPHRCISIGPTPCAYSVVARPSFMDRLLTLVVPTPHSTYNAIQKHNNLGIYSGAKNLGRCMGVPRLQIYPSG